MTVNRLIIDKSLHITVQKHLGAVISCFILSMNKIISTFFILSQLETYSAKRNINTIVRPFEEISFDLKNLKGLI